MSAASISSAPVLVWFRQDLRLADNPALAAALASTRPIVCVFVLDDEAPGAWRRGAASRWWLHHSLGALSRDIAQRGAGLVLRRGSAAKIIPRLAAEIGAGLVVWSRQYEPWATARDSAIKAALKRAGVAAESFNSALLVEPWELKPASGGTYFKVYSPFWRAALARGGPPAAILAPSKLLSFDPMPAGDALSDWRLAPLKPDWAAGFSAHWTPGEAGAHQRLAAFFRSEAVGYGELRNRPDLPATSRLSPHLHFGEISPGAIWRAAQLACAQGGVPDGDVAKLIAEIGWREFSNHLLFHAPTLPEENWRARFNAFPWREDAGLIEAWRRGQTGYPIVDAGMRQLWATGWMHNRVRMITASFLIKHLMTHWRVGADWFWDTLVDADLANNAASWQWVAGSGADAAPYFRIFNPVTQGEKFDPNGAYVRRWAPELAGLDARAIHQPWTAAPFDLAAAGVTLGKTYPKPIIDHAAARARALAAFETVKSAA
jgi:deoxyribodipyrimidine photo-lyase